MKVLYLLRHAKSDWSQNGQRDFDRPLNPRGRRAAAQMRHFLAESGIKPDLVLCSPAQRTRETLDLLAPALSAPVEFAPEIYEAEWPDLLARLRRLPAQADRVMMIGHNPGMAALAAILTRPNDGNRADLARMREKFPTAALAALDCDITDWENLRPATASLQSFTRPKDLD